jgi:hypothetical protein
MALKSKKCGDCKMRPLSSSVIGPELCDTCLEYSDHENMRTDDGHEDNEESAGFTMAQCMVCHPELDNRYGIPKTGHTNTVAKTRGSHAACDHDVTPKARAACRKARATK